MIMCVPAVPLPRHYTSIKVALRLNGSRGSIRAMAYRDMIREMG